jgi:hypothetical protein
MRREACRHSSLTRGTNCQQERTVYWRSDITHRPIAAQAWVSLEGRRSLLVNVDRWPSDGLNKTRQNSDVLQSSVSRLVSIGRQKTNLAM